MPGAQWDSCGFYEEEIAKISLESTDLHQWSQNPPKKATFVQACLQWTRQCHENNSDKESLSSLVLSLVSFTEV